MQQDAHSSCFIAARANMKASGGLPEMAKDTAKQQIRHGAAGFTRDCFGGFCDKIVLTSRRVFTQSSRQHQDGGS